MRHSCITTTMNHYGTALKADMRVAHEKVRAQVQEISSKLKFFRFLGWEMGIEPTSKRNFKYLERASSTLKLKSSRSKARVTPGNDLP
jgi:hypothetical protein